MQLEVGIFPHFFFFTLILFEKIVIADAKVDISVILADAVRKLSSFLRKANRTLKTTSINSLSSLVNNYGTSKDFHGLHNLIIEELSRQGIEKKEKETKKKNAIVSDKEK